MSLETYISQMVDSGMLSEHPNGGYVPSPHPEQCPRLDCRPMAKNQLYYGDNLEVLGKYIKDESVDLV